jgi:hypothetical protein
MKIETTEPGLVRCFSGGELTSVDSAWLAREARKRVSLDAQAFRDFEEQYRQETGDDWDRHPHGLLLTTERVPTTIALKQFLQLYGFPDSVAHAQAQRVIGTRHHWLNHRPIRTGLMVVLGTGATGQGGGQQTREVILRGRMDEQILLTQALAPGARRQELAKLIQRACNHVADLCREDPGFRDALFASDWAAGPSTPFALRNLARGHSAGLGSAARDTDHRALLELSLCLYLQKQGFDGVAGELGTHLADAWSGQAPALSGFRFVSGFPEEERFEKITLISRQAQSVGGVLLASAGPFILANFPAGGGGGDPSPPETADELMVKYPIKVPRGMKTEEELDRYAEVLIFGRVVNVRWKKLGWDVPGFARKGQTVYYLYRASEVRQFGGRDVSQVVRPPARNSAYEGTQGTRRRALNREIDKRYWEGTGIPRGQQIKKGDQAKEDMWNFYRDEVMEDQQRIKDLPPEYKALMGGEASFEPADYARILRIAEKLKQFTPEDIALFNLVAVRTAHDLDLFERSVNLFLARKEELRQALEDLKHRSEGTAPETMEAAIEKSWTGADLSKIGKMSWSDQYLLAQSQTWKATQAQLAYMAEHPGEVAVDFAKTATLLNTAETFSAMGKDLTEIANGDANAWARWAAGFGFGAKLSGWLMAVCGVLFVLSWLAGAGPLATLAALMGRLLAAAIVLSLVESELRVVAASKAKTPEEFKEQVNKAAAARLNWMIMLALLGLACAIRFVAKTYFPQHVKNLQQTLARLREKVRIFGKLADKKAEIAAELKSYKGRLEHEGKLAKDAAIAQADAIEAMSLDEFIAKMESGEFLPEAKLQEGQKIPWKQLAETPAGLKAIEAFRQRFANDLRSGIVKEIDALVKEQTDAIDVTLDKVDKATLPDELSKALTEHEGFLRDEEVAARAKVRQERALQRAAEEALAFKDPPPLELRTVAEQLRVPIPETDPKLARAKRWEVIKELRNVHGAERPPKYEGYVFDKIVAENQAALASSRAALHKMNPDVIVGMERGGSFLTEALTHGDPVLAAKVRKMQVHKAPAGQPSKKGKYDGPKMQAEFQKLIDAGAKQIVVYDAYMGGTTKRSLIKQIFEPLSAKHPDVTFHMYWLREAFGLEGAEIVGLEQHSKSIMSTYEKVTLVLGDDMDVVLSPDGKASLRIFNTEGKVTEVVTPKPGQSTRQALIELLNRAPSTVQPPGNTGLPVVLPPPNPGQKEE